MRRSSSVSPKRRSSAVAPNDDSDSDADSQPTDEAIKEKDAGSDGSYSSDDDDFDGEGGGGKGDEDKEEGQAGALGWLGSLLFGGAKEPDPYLRKYHQASATPWPLPCAAPQVSGAILLGRLFLILLVTVLCLL